MVAVLDEIRSDSRHISADERRQIIPKRKEVRIRSKERNRQYYSGQIAISWGLWASYDIQYEMIITSDASKWGESQRKETK